MAEYPEAEKVEKQTHKINAIGNFLEWLNGERGVVLCVWHDDEYFDAEGKRVEEYDPKGFIEHSKYIPIRKTTMDLIIEYFELDAEKYEEEKRAMLAKLRGA